MRHLNLTVLATLICATLVSSGLAEPVKLKPKIPAGNWLPLWENVSARSRKEKKPILAYFCCSDQGGGQPEAYTGKLDKDVLNTEMFKDWSDKNVILFKVDFPNKEAKQSPLIKTQNDQLRQRYSITTVPVFVLMDFSGSPFNRAYFDQAKLRDEEGKGEPKAWIAYLENAIKNKPPDEQLLMHKNLTDAIAWGKKHYQSTVVLINHDVMPRTLQTKDDLTHAQEFVKFLNRNVSFVEVQWPSDGDPSPDAAFFKQFAVTQQLNDTTPLQLVVYDMQTKKVNFKLTAINPMRVDQIIHMIEEHLPKPDYNGTEWITDFHLANHIADSQKRYIFLCFTSMDKGDFSQKMFDEIFSTPEFKKYARQKLVTVQLDFPGVGDKVAPPDPNKVAAPPEDVVDPHNPPPDPIPVATPVRKPVVVAPKPKRAPAATQPAGLIAQNKELADKYNVRGFPYVIVLNPKGQKIADTKYMKGGPEAFLKNLDAAVKNDEERQAFLSGNQ